MDKNFAIHLPLIDWLFGTLHLPGGWPNAYGIAGNPVPEIFDAGFVPLELEAGLRHVLPFDHVDAVVPLELCQLGFKFRYLVLVILGLLPEVQSAEDKEVLVLTGLVAKDCAREGLVPAEF